MEKEEIQSIRKKYGDDKLLKCKGAFGVDVDYKRVKGKKTDKLCITVYVKEKLPKEELGVDEAVPTEIEGVPTDVFECPNMWPLPKISEQLHVAAAKPMPTTDPLVGGLSIGNQNMPTDYGTLGIIVKCSTSVPSAISCAHVMVSSLPGILQTVVEPALTPEPYTQYSIGTVSQAVYGDSRNIDFALVPVQGRGATPGYIQNIGQITGLIAPAPQQIVSKMGARTGLRHGVIGSTTFTYQLDTHLGPFALYDQIRVDNVEVDFALPGDSGAAVVTKISGHLYMVGVVVAGVPDEFAVCNSASHIQQHFPNLF